MELAIKILEERKKELDYNLKFNDDMKVVEKEIIQSNESTWEKCSRLMALGDPLPYNKKEHEQLIEAINQLESIKSINELIK